MFMIRSITATPLKAWIGDGSVWTPVPGGLCGNPEFDADMSKTAPWAVLQIFSKLALTNAGRSKTAPWAVLQIFSKLALTNAGRRAKRVIARINSRTIHELMIFNPAVYVIN